MRKKVIDTIKLRLIASLATAHKNHLNYFTVTIRFLS